MGAGFNVGEGGIHRINGRREFNWWFDPEAVRIAMSAPWKKIVITPVDISVKTRLSDEHQGPRSQSQDAGRRLPHRNSPAAATCGTRFRRWPGWIPRSSRSSRSSTSTSTSIMAPAMARQSSWRRTWRAGAGRPPVPRKMAAWWQLATVQWDLDTAKFYKMYIDLMSRPPRSRSVRCEVSGDARVSHVAQSLRRALPGDCQPSSRLRRVGSQPSGGSRKKVFIDQDGAAPRRHRHAVHAGAAAIAGRRGARHHRDRPATSG